MASSNNTIRFVIKTVTEGGKEVQALGVNVKDLAEMIAATQRKANKGIRLGVETVGFDATINLINKLNTILKDLSGAYKVQEQAETKLAQAMKNTMGASEDEIQSIKDLCSAQQSLGVIGDEVQLQGAERLSTYLQTTDALKDLIPLMNDLTVKQYGMDASGNDAASAAAMLGKAMQGNVTALKRMGIEFSDAQKTILEYGSEAEKVALLIDVVGSKVGEMNSEVAKTDSGKMKQFENRLGDLKEMAGKAVSSIAPLLDGLSQVGTTALGVSGIIKGFNTLLPVTSKVMDFASASAKKLGISLRSMMIASGVGVAIAALTFVIEKLMDVSDKASDSLDNLSGAEKRAKESAEEREEVEKKVSRAYGEAKAVMDIYIKRTGDLVTAGKEDKKLVEELNEVYGQRIGYFSSVSEWYKALISDSEAYCAQIQAEARVVALTDRLKDIEAKKSEILYDENGNKKTYSTKPSSDEQMIVSNPEDADFMKTISDGAGGFINQYIKNIGKSEHQKAQEAIYELNKDREQVQKNLQEALGSSKIDLPVVGSPEPKKETNKDTKSKIESEKKAREEQIRAKEAADKILKDLEKKYSDEAIALIRDDDKRQRAEINKSYFDRMELIAQKEKELTDLRIAEGKEGLDESERELLKYARDLAEQTRERALNELTPLGAEGIKTFEELSTALSYWNDKFLKASEEERAQIRKTISTLEDLKNSFELESDFFDRQKELDKLKELDGRQLKIEINSVGMDGWLDKMNEMQRIMSDTSATDKQREAAAKLREEYRLLAAESINYMDAVSAGWSNIKGLGNNIQSLTEALSGQKDAWETITTVIDSALSIYQTVMQVMEMINTFSSIFNGLKIAEENVTESAAQTQAASNLEVAGTNVAMATTADLAAEANTKLAASQFFAAHASIPFAGFGIASGFVSGMEAIMAALSIPKFANGGIVSGPTLGLMGEYAGASSNPEVIAPLDKLQSMLGETGPGIVRVVGVSTVTGRQIVTLLRNETNVTSKSGRKTNIII